jgi:hypothetical protein
MNDEFCASQNVMTPETLWKLGRLSVLEFQPMLKYNIK